MADRETKHTPGPWRVEPSIYEHMGAEIVGKRGIAQLWAGPRTMADACLIAAAPDLLDALRAQVRSFQMIAPRIGFTDQDIADGTSQARAAIAKAEGRADG